MRTILYITYDGLTDPLGQSQILAYLKRLSAQRNNIVIVSFEKEELYQKDADKIKAIVDKNRLTWVPLSYTKKPPVFSTLNDLRKGYRTCKQLQTQHHFDIVHCRGYIPALLGLRLQKEYGLKFIFDMRAWWADEKIESGYWDKKIYRPIYNFFKRKEKDFFGKSDYVVSLTYKGKEEIIRQGLASERKIGVIPTCVDFDIFKPREQERAKTVRSSLGIQEHERVFIYSGSLGGNYDPDILIAIFNLFRKLNWHSYLLILSKDKLDSSLRTRFQNAGIERMTMLSVPFTQVTDYLCAGDVGFIYYKMSFSTIGRSPTKMGEYWASGVPVISFKGIGDLDYILEKYTGSGILLPVDESKWESELQQLNVAEPEALRSYALDYFHVNKGVDFYQSVYEKLVPDSTPADVH